jgi:hypothetical protein
MSQILFEDLGMNLGLTRITFIRERTQEERDQFEINRRRGIINNAILGFHRERALNERIQEYRREEFEQHFIEIIRDRIFFESIPEEFWEPVKVTTSMDGFEFTDENWECLICCEGRTKKTQLKCCQQDLCDNCAEKWFVKESVRCPFCKKDIREINNIEN